MSESLFIIDGHSHCYQAYYAIRELTTPDGQPINAVYAFTGMLRRLLNEYKPTHLVVVFDSAGPTFRHEQFEGYKANRKAPPDDLLSQFPLIYEILKAYNVPIYSYEGYEADDLIGTIAKETSAKKIPTFIVSADKDLEQLINPYVKVVNTRRGKIIDLETFKKEKGIKPEQVADVFALAGDSIDNIPGVPGIGLKTALDLVREWGSLEGVLSNIDKIKGNKKQENLKRFSQQAQVSKDLATICVDVPVEFDFDACRLNGVNEVELKKLFQRFGFKSLLSQMVSKPSSVEERTNYNLIDTYEKLVDFLHKLKEQEEFALDLETTSLVAVNAEIVGLSFSWMEKEAYYLPVKAPQGQAFLDVKKVINELKPILENVEIKKFGQNVKYDFMVLKNYGIDLQGISFDSMVASYLLNPTRLRHNLDDLAMDFLSYETMSITELIGQGKNQITMDKVAVERVCPYACQDADIAYRLAVLLRAKLKENELWDLFRDVEIPLISVLGEMERQGICLKSDVLQVLSFQLAKQINELERHIYEVAGEEFNINSPKQLSGVLFDKLGLPRLRKIKTGSSTTSTVLTELAGKHELPALVIEYRQLSKLKSTYVDALPTMINKKTSRIHASFNQTITATGRLSSSNPNLQNIPIRTDLGRQIRSAFVPSEEGEVFLAADYSQIELRILAHFSGDRALIEAFEHDKDIHASVAAEIYGVSIDSVTSDMRRAAKVVNFGIIYGLGAQGLSRDIGISVNEAKEFIKAYFELYKDVKRFNEHTIDKAKQLGYVTTILNRKRPIIGIDSKDNQKRSLAERTAINTVIQGSAADLIKIAMNRIFTRLKQEGYKTRMLLQIHDELLFEVPEAELPLCKDMVSKEMSAALELKVPIKVNISVGKNWMDVG
ncbi:MAG: DNA polymerase I [Candidatus Brocadiales bacterium]